MYVSVVQSKTCKPSYMATLLTWLDIVTNLYSLTTYLCTYIHTSVFMQVTGGDGQKLPRDWVYCFVYSRIGSVFLEKYETIDYSYFLLGQFS